ncbi:uncharacterized protein LOC129609779 [Condylostylus longicornis]|uniref:uncharacterized protein LOC129609779 n=1 Tax=Condylostylus longicornis TaxID=2530218 RepID=UPI00244DEAF0|nr:uncharacterized protein LOC129609779 [Condylostylus longicornis]
MTLDAKLRWKEHVKKKKTELELKGQVERPMNLGLKSSSSYHQHHQIIMIAQHQNERAAFVSILLFCVIEFVSSGQTEVNQQKLGFNNNHNILTTINNPDNNKLAEYYDALVKNKLDNLAANLTENEYREIQRIFSQFPINNNANYGNDDLRPCTCGVFLSNQIRKKHVLDNDSPTITQEIDKIFPCTKMGARKCQNECFQLLLQYLPQSAEIICALVGQDIHKMRAHLFVQNCDSQWHNSNLSAGREYCCKGGLPYHCPLF